MSLVSLVIMWRRMWPYHSIIQRFQNAATTIFFMRRTTQSKSGSAPGRPVRMSRQEAEL